jgi:hypothetical protein
MSFVYKEVEKLVIEILTSPGIHYDFQVHEYVNNRSSVPVNKETINFIVEKWFSLGNHH